MKKKKKNKTKRISTSNPEGVNLFLSFKTFTNGASTGRGQYN